jgi:hypothetical protein
MGYTVVKRYGTRCYLKLENQNPLGVHHKSNEGRMVEGHVHSKTIFLRRQRVLVCTLVY